MTTQEKKLKVWSKKVKTDIEAQIDDIYKKDYKFYKIDRLERMSERIDEYSDSCSDCETFKIEVEDIVINLTKSLTGSLKLRSDYEKRNEKIVKHLKEVHHLSYKEFFASVYSFVGFASGSIVLGGISWLINPDYLVFGLLTCFTIGIIAGRMIGKKKDKEKESLDLIL